MKRNEIIDLLKQYVEPKTGYLAVDIGQLADEIEALYKEQTDA